MIMRIKRTGILLRLICLCIVCITAFLGLQVLAATQGGTANNAVLQVNSVASAATAEDGKITVSLAADDTFTYNEILDLSALSDTDPLLELTFDPVSVGAADATRVKIRFTDLFNEENYVTVSLNNITDDWANGLTYITAGAAQQPQVGIENAGSDTDKNVYVNDPYGYGAAVNFSMVGLPKAETDTLLTLYYNYEEKAFYADREAYTGQRQLVADLDDPVCFGEQLWEGFTAGYVKMSVFAYNYQADTCNFTVSTICGNSELKGGSDETAPLVFADTGYEPEQIPHALVGKPYPLFPAQAIDGCDGKLSVETAVYYQYDTENPVEIPVEDGTFTPAEEGVYTIVCKSEDRSGNVGAVCVNVTAVTGEGLCLTLQDVVTETDTGVAVKVISGMEYSSASGNVACSVVAKHLSDGTQLEIDSRTFEFIPMKTGEWEITVSVRDYISEVTQTFILTANPTTQPQVYDDTGVWQYFIKDSTYQLSALYAYDFSSGEGLLTPMEIYVTESGGAEQKLENGSYTPSTAGDVTVTYRLTVDGKTCEKSYAATVVSLKSSLGLVSMQKYFVDPEGAAASSAATSYLSYTVQKDTRLQFINFVQVKELTFSFQVGSSKAYDRINLYLTDTVSGKQMKFSYIRTDSGTAFSVNDGAETAVSTAFDTTKFSITFCGDTGIVTPVDGLNIAARNFTDGSPFTGFTGSVAGFCVELGDVTGSSEIRLTKLNGQALKRNYSAEKTAPQLFAADKGGQWDVGDIFALTGAFACDVLDPKTTLTMIVTDPDGACVTDLNGVALDGTQDAADDHEFILDQAGDYTVSYTARDGKGNSTKQTYTVTAIDAVGPTVSVLDHAETAKPGETVTIAGVEVTDNITADCTVVSYVFDPTGVNIPVTEGTFEAALEGAYTVRYMACDEDGNYSFASYEIAVYPEKSQYISQSLSLGSDLTLNLWGNPPESYVSTLSAVLTCGGVTEEFRLSGLTRAENGLYHIQAQMAVAQMTENIGLTLEHSSIGAVMQKTYSIRNYLVNIIEGDYNEMTKNLCYELLNMGAMAQKYFDYNTDAPANADYEIDPANAVPAENPVPSCTGAVSGITFYGASVRFLSKTAVRFYFKADAADGCTFTIGDTQYTPVEKDGMYYIETPGINPQDMSNEITVEVTDGTDTLSVAYAPMWYFIRKYNNSSDETAKNMMAAAYSYYTEAEAYIYSEETGTVEQPETPTGQGVYICMDVLLNTQSNSTDPINVGFYAYDYTGSVKEGFTDLVAVTPGVKTTIKLDASRYMVDGVIPEGLGVAVLGGPAGTELPADGQTADSYTLTVYNARLKGAYEKTLDLGSATVAGGAEDTGYTDAGSAGTATVADGRIIITGGLCYDGYKITLQKGSVE